MRSRRDLLRVQLDEAYRMLRDRVDGLTDDEFWWAPAPAEWTIRRTERGTWTADYEEPDPVPAPLTTLGWRLVHVAECKLMYHEYAFGDARLTWPEIDSAHTAPDAVRALEAGQDLLVRALDAEDDDGLDRSVRTNWGEAWPAWRVYWTMIHHDLWHGGEIGLLRDLHRVMSEEGPAQEANRPQDVGGTSTRRPTSSA